MKILVGNDLESCTVRANSSGREVLEKLDYWGYRFVVVVDQDGKVQGVLSDGDIRRGMLKNLSLSDSAEVFLRQDFEFLDGHSTHEQVLARLAQFGTTPFPVLDASRTLQMVVLPEGSWGPAIPFSAVLMAGGRGSRMGALTSSKPKPLVEVKGRPLIDWNLSKLASSGIIDVTITVSYLASQIQDYVGDGSQFGLNISYEFEEDYLGTAGSVLNVLPSMKRDFVVVNADVIHDSMLNKICAAHLISKSPVTAITRILSQEVPFGVVDNFGSSITSIREKPIVEFEVLAGIYIFNKETLSGVVSDRGYIDMPQLLTSLLAAGVNVTRVPHDGTWVDVGNSARLAQAEEQVAKWI